MQLWSHGDYLTNTYTNIFIWSQFFFFEFHFVLKFQNSRWAISNLTVFTVVYQTTVFVHTRWVSTFLTEFLNIQF